MCDATIGGASLLRIEHPTRADHGGEDPLAEPCWGETTEQRAARVAALSRRLTPRQRRRLARKARAR